MPGLEFYELRHRALQWMIDALDDGGLSLDIQTAAQIAGHSDGGYLVCSTYTKLAQRQANARARSANGRLPTPPREPSDLNPVTPPVAKCGTVFV
jgi:predicted esterase